MEKFFPMGGLCIAALCMPAAVHAEMAADLVSGDTIIVTAARSAQKLEDVQAAVSVILRDQLDTYSGASAIEALRQAPGVDARSGGPTSSVVIRGFIPGSGSNTLVLYDGLPRTAKYGTTNLNNFSAEDIERIEIVRGPMSALYGVGAGGGVVNIITRAPGEGALLATSTIYGSDGHGRRESINLNAAGNFQTGSIGHRISAGWRNAEGFRYDDDSPAEDLSGINHLSLSYAAAWRTGAHEVRALYQYFRQRDNRDSVLIAPPAEPQPFTLFEREDIHYGSLTYSGPAGPGTLSADLAYSHSDGIANRGFPIEDTTRYGQWVAQARYALTIGAHSLIAGAGWQEDDLNVSIYSDVPKDRTLHAFLQDEWKITPQLTLTAGGRFDDFNRFGSTFNPRGVLGWKSGFGLHARVGYGRAFRTPTLTENFSRFTRGRSIILGSPDLRPEKSRTWEAATGWSGEQARIEAVWHDSHISDLIESWNPGTTIGGLVVAQFHNRGKAHIRGLELDGQLQPAPWLELNASYAYLDAADGNTGERLPNRAEHTVKIATTVTSGPWKATLRNRFMFNLWGADPAVRGGPMFNTQYEVSDANLEYRVSRHITLAAGVDNLFDRRVPVNYSPYGTIEDPSGRYFYFSIRSSLD